MPNDFRCPEINVDHIVYFFSVVCLKVWITWAKSCWPWKMLASMKTMNSGILGRVGMSIPSTFTLNFLLQSHMEMVNTRSWSFSSMVSCSWVPDKEKLGEELLPLKLCLHASGWPHLNKLELIPATPVQSSTCAQSSFWTRSKSGSGGVSRTR